MVQIIQKGAYLVKLLFQNKRYRVVFSIFRCR